MQKQVRTIMCGCGMCQFRPSASDLCPMGNSKDAIQLWASDFSIPVSEGAEDIETELAEVIAEIELESA
jgi:hypothetical protein